MRAFFAAFDTSLTPKQLTAKRRRMRERLRAHGVELQALAVGKNRKTLIDRLVIEARSAAIVTLDDEHAIPSEAPWLAELTEEVMDLVEPSRPRVVYVTSGTGVAGQLQASQHPIVSAWIKRGDGNLWVDAVVEAVLDLAEQFQAITPQPAAAPIIPDIVGDSPCFREALADLEEIMRSPYGMITGEPGTGKMFLIRSVWRQIAGDVRPIILPCGSFYKDYYVAGGRRRYGGGREAIDQLTPYLDEADKGLLVLHRVEELPTAVQEELAVRLPPSTGRSETATRLVGVDREGLVERDVKIIATSESPPELLEQTGRVIPDFLAKLRKRHVRIPSLAQRGQEDTRMICEDIMQRISLSKGLTPPVRMGAAVARKLSRAVWPNNTSDLIAVLEHAVRRCKGRMITMQHLPKGIADLSRRGRPATLPDIVAQAQKAAIQNALGQTAGSVPKAAGLLGVSRYALYRLMPKLGLPTGPKPRQRHGSRR